MNRDKLKFFRVVAVVMMLPVVAAEASHRSSTTAGAIIYNSIVSAEQKIALGVNREGHLNTRTGDITSNASATGLAYKWANGRWIDATSPGCLCEGWGVSGNGHVGRANVAVGGVSGLTVESFETSTANITSVTSIGPTDNKVLQITHEYGPSPEAQHRLFQGLVTVTNISDKVVKNVRYRRVMDWDIHPTEFSEYVSHGGVSASLGAAAAPKLIDACDNGFENPTPFGGCRPFDYGTKNRDFNHSGPRDHGSSFNFQLPDLDCGESISFMIYYGVADTRALALDAVDAVDASIYSLGASRSSRDGITYIFGFKGVSGVRLTTELPPKAGSLPSLTKVQTSNDVFLYGDAAYQSTFLYRRDRQWKGYLKRYNLKKDGSISSSGIVDAGEKLKTKSSSDRRIWTAANGTLTAARTNDNFTTSNRTVLKSELHRDSIDTVDDDEVDDLINFIRGVDSYDEDGDGNYTEDRDWKLADINHANLTIAPPPSNSDSSSSEKSRAYYKKTRATPYSSFVTANEERNTVLYAAANDGMLHAFDSTTMDELWAFVPPPALDKLRSIYKSKGSGGIKGKTNSVYLVDGTPTIKDIFYGGSWKSVLMAGLGYGGKGYYAIDVTDPDAPSHLFSFVHNSDKNIIDYWDSSGTRTTYDRKEEIVPPALDYRYLGEAWARPFIALIPHNETQRWVAVLGGGYAGAAGIDHYGSYVYIIDLEPNTSKSGKLGTVLSKIEIEPLAPSITDVSNGVVAPVSAITVDSASSADYYGSLIYLADLQGRTWKLDLAKDNLKDPDSGLFAIEEHLKAETTLANDRQMYHKPVNDFLSGTPYHFMGTGDMTRLQRRDSTIANRFFAIKDADYPLSAKSSGDTSLPYTVSSLKDASTRICPEPSQKGWYQNLSNVLSGTSQGAKVTGDAAISSSSKNVYFTAYVPSSDLTCSVDGESSLVVLTKECGIQEVAADKLGKGVATTPVIYKGNLYIGVGNRGEKDKDFGGGAPNIYRKDLTDTEEEEGESRKNYSIESWREKF